MNLFFAFFSINSRTENWLAHIHMSEGPHWQVYSNHSLWRRYAPSWSRFQEKQQRHLQVFLCLKKKMCLFLCILFIAMFPGVSCFFCVNQYTENFRIICCLIMLLFKDIWKHINCAAKEKKNYYLQLSWNTYFIWFCFQVQLLDEIHAEVYLFY